MKIFPVLVLVLTSTLTSVLASSAISLPASDNSRPRPEHRSELWKRKGGGGGGHGSAGGSSSGGGGGGRGGGSSTGSSSGSSGGAGSAGGSGYRGVTPSYGGKGGAGGGSYAGGASTPYRSGGVSGRGLAAGAFLGVGALAIFPGLWLYGAYPYYFNRPYSFQNSTTNKNESLPVVCLCEQYNPCGCDQSNDTSYAQSVVGDGSYGGLNKSVANVADINGTKTLVLNGTLPNGTDFVNSDGTSATGSTNSASRATQLVLEGLGWWVCLAVVGAITMTVGV